MALSLHTLPGKMRLSGITRTLGSPHLHRREIQAALPVELGHWLAVSRYGRHQRIDVRLIACIGNSARTQQWSADLCDLEGRTH